MSPPTSLCGKHVVFVLGTLHIGGAETQALGLARYLQERCGARCTVVGPGEVGPVGAICAQMGITLRQLPALWSEGRRERYLAIARLGRLLRSLRPDVLLPFTQRPNVGVGVVWRFTGAKWCVWNQRDIGIDYAPSGLQRLAVRQTPRFVANCEAGAGFLRDVLGAPPGKVSVVHNWVVIGPARATREEWRTTIGIDDRCPVAVMVANLSVYKRHEDAIRAWRHVVEGASSVSGPPHLLFAGRDDGEAGRLASLVRQLGLEGVVHFLGPVTDIAGLLSAADIGLLCSPSEGLPNAVLEYLSAGLPVVGSDVPGIAEAVGAVNLEWLAPVGDPETLAGEVLRLLRSPQERMRVGRANRTRSVECFSLDRQCGSYVQQALL